MNPSVTMPRARPVPADARGARQRPPGGARRAGARDAARWRCCSTRKHGDARRGAGRMRWRCCRLRAPRGVPLVRQRRLAPGRRARRCGAHLGGEDGDLREARGGARRRTRSSAPRATTSSARAQAARDAGASYLAFGAFFASGTKPLARARAAVAARRGAPRSACRVVAIGGIDADNAALAARRRRRPRWPCIGAVFDAPIRPPRRAPSHRCFSMTNPTHEPADQPRTVRPRPATDARRRQLAGARLQVGRRRALLRRSAPRAPGSSTSTATATSTTSAAGAR